jgi:hypothetical protein
VRPVAAADHLASRCVQLMAWQFMSADQCGTYTDRSALATMASSRTTPMRSAHARVRPAQYTREGPEAAVRPRLGPKEV